MRRLGLITVGTPQQAPELLNPAVAAHVGQIITNTTRPSDIARLASLHPHVRRIYGFDLGFFGVRDATGGNPRDYWQQWDPDQANDPMVRISAEAYAQHGRGVNWAQDFDMSRHMPGNTKRVVAWITSDCPRGRDGEANGLNFFQFTAHVLRTWWDIYGNSSWQGIHLDGWPRLYAGTLGLADRAANMESEFRRWIIPVLTHIRERGGTVSCTGWGPTPGWPNSIEWATAYKGEDYWEGTGETWRRSAPSQWMTYYDSPHGNATHLRQGWKVAARPGSTFMVRPVTRDASLVSHAVNTFLLGASNSDDGPFFSLQHDQGYHPHSFADLYPLLFRRLTEAQTRGPAVEDGGRVARPFNPPSKALQFVKDRWYGVRYMPTPITAIYFDRPARWLGQWGTR